VTRIDPDWAWRPYEPSEQQPWNRRTVAHLFRRAAFGAGSREVDEAVKREPSEVVAQLMTGPSEADDSESESFAQAVLASGEPKRLSAWWVYRLFQTQFPLRENLTLFWHGHFATSADKVTDARAMYDQNQLLRRYALGDFAAMVHGIARDPAMLIYLDSVTNRKAHPNENFARELMELFCLGEGNYSERDVQELARCFTGWEIRRSRFRFNRYQHDAGSKTILGTSGPFPEQTAIDLVLQQPAASRFVARKLVRYLVFDEPDPTPDLIEPLAQQLRQQDWDIGALVKRILASNLFFSEHAIGHKVRSPVDLTIGFLRSLDGTTNAQVLSEELGHLGQGLFFPPNVKGWDGGRAWINASTLLGRVNVVGRLLRDNTTRFGGGDLQSYFQRRELRTAEEIIAELCETMLAVPIPETARQRLVELAQKASGGPNQRITKAIHAMAALPEFQLG
jgi:uncharacterized protein (DUF1800 family)